MEYGGYSRDILHCSITQLFDPTGEGKDEAGSLGCKPDLSGCNVPSHGVPPGNITPLTIELDMDCHPPPCAEVVLADEVAADPGPYLGKLIRLLGR